MDPGQIIIWSVGLLSFFGWPVGLAWVITRHREKLRLLEMQKRSTPEFRQEIDALRSEISQLRETTTHFDMSFDVALSRLEGRLESLERAPDTVQNAEQPSTYPTAANPTVEPDTLPLRRY